MSSAHVHTGHVYTDIIIKMNVLKDGMSGHALLLLIKLIHTLRNLTFIFL